MHHNPSGFCTAAGLSVRCQYPRGLGNIRTSVQQQLVHIERWSDLAGHGVIARVARK